MWFACYARASISDVCYNDSEGCCGKHASVHSIAYVLNKNVMCDMLEVVQL